MFFPPYHTASHEKCKTLDAGEFPGQAVISENLLRLFSSHRSTGAIIQKAKVARYIRDHSGPEIPHRSLVRDTWTHGSGLACFLLVQQLITGDQLKWASLGNILIKSFSYFLFWCSNFCMLFHSQCFLLEEVEGGGAGGQDPKVQHLTGILQLCETKQQP